MKQYILLLVLLALVAFVCAEKLTKKQSRVATLANTKSKPAKKTQGTKASKPQVRTSTNKSTKKTSKPSKSATKPNKNSKKQPKKVNRASNPKTSKKSAKKSVQRVVRKAPTVAKKGDKKAAPKQVVAAVAPKVVKNAAPKQIATASSAKQPKKAVHLHTVNDSVNIRAGACTDKKVVANIPKHTNMIFSGEVKTACGYTWFNVKGSFGTGFIASKFVKEGKAPVKPSNGGNNGSNNTPSMSGAYNCGQSYTSGKPTGDKQCVKIDGKPVVVATAQHYNTMKAAAAKAGIRLSLNSGFRLNSEQVYLYNCYKTKKCNNGNRAAPPGYSNHQNGLALDISTVNANTYAWLRTHASKFGFVRTVGDETWHFEYRPGQSCSSFVKYSCN